MENKEDRRFLTKEEIANEMNVKERTVQSWIANGVLPHIKIAGTVRILRSDFEDAITNNRFRGKVPVNGTHDDN